MLVAGGTTNCSTCYADELEIYDPATNVWTPMGTSARQAFKYYPHLYVLPDGRVFLAAEDDKAIASQVLNLTTQTWTVVDSRIIDGHSSAMYLPGRVMKCGKAVADAQGFPAVNTSYWIDMTQTGATWQAGGNMQFPRSHHNLTILPDGQVLVTGGGRTTDKADFTTAVLAAELWNPTTKNWTTMASMQTPRLYHSTALLLPDATVLVAGGGRQNGRSQPDPKDQQNAEIYSPPYLFKGPRPVITAAPAVLSYGTAFQVTTPDAARIASVSMIPLGAVTHAYNETQRFVPVAFTAGANSITVTPPADGNTAPPGNYMLFLVDNQGIPSVAAMVRLPAAATDGQPPSAPATLNATVNGASVNLSWSAATDNVGVTGYNVHRSTTSGFTPSTGNRIAQPSTTSYTDAPPGPGTYYYKVTAQDARGNVGSPSPQASATIVASVPDLTIGSRTRGRLPRARPGRRTRSRSRTRSRCDLGNRHRHRHAPRGAHRDEPHRHRVDVQRRDPDVHAQRRARRLGELSGDHPDRGRVGVGGVICDQLGLGVGAAARRTPRTTRRTIRRRSIPRGAVTRFRSCSCSTPGRTRGPRRPRRSPSPRRTRRGTSSSSRFAPARPVRPSRSAIPAATPTARRSSRASRSTR
jgi:hypothetical protein